MSPWVWYVLGVVTGASWGATIALRYMRRYIERELKPRWERGNMNKEEDERIAELDAKREVAEGMKRLREKRNGLLDRLTPEEREILCQRLGVKTIDDLKKE